MRGSGHLRPVARPANSMEQDSFDSTIEDDMEELSMAAGGMRIGRGGSASSSVDGGSSPPGMRGGSGVLASRKAADELPKSVIVTNVDEKVFDDDDTKAHFESLFREIEAGALFHYLRSFRRIRVDYESHLSASKAKMTMDNTPIGEKNIHCYFIQVLSPCASEDAYLHVPPLEKQFLISPPSSPPVGWEQPREDKPVQLDYDLLAAMASLGPGDKHELHPTKQINVLGKSISTPSIVVHIASDGEIVAATTHGPTQRQHSIPTITTTFASSTSGSNFGKKIKPTRCPDRQSSLD